MICRVRPGAKDPSRGLQFVSYRAIRPRVGRRCRYLSPSLSEDLRLACGVQGLGDSHGGEGDGLAAENVPGGWLLVTSRCFQGTEVPLPVRAQ
jgi:hypothetical protein